MTNQQIRTTAKQSSKAIHLQKPKTTAAMRAHKSGMLQRFLDDPFHTSPQTVLSVQKSTGNRATTQLLQTNLLVGAAGDRAEQEAAQVAEQVISAPQPATQSVPTVQRSEEEELQRWFAPQGAEAAAPYLIQRAAGPNAAHEIKSEDIEYEIVAHRLAYEASIPAGAKSWLDSRGYQQEWHPTQVIGSGLAARLLLPKTGADLKRRAIVAFKGTTPTKAGDVLADLDPVAVGFTAFKTHQAEVGALMNIGCAASSACGAGNQVDVVGHSLGGALAQHAASAFPGNVKRLVTFQAPGITSIQANTFKGTQDVTHHIATGDIVDLAGGKHLPGNVFLHDVEGLGVTHVQYLLNSDAFKSQRDALGLTESVLKEMGIASDDPKRDNRAHHSGQVTKTAGYPFRVRQFAVERAREAASPLGSLAVGGVTATLGLLSGAKNSWQAGMNGANAAWQWGGNLAESAWQGTRSWGRDEQGQAKSGVGNWFKRLGGNILGGLGVAGGRVLGGLGALGAGALGTVGAAGAGVGALATGAGTLAAGLSAGAMGLGGLAVGGVLGAGKWLGEKSAAGLGQMGKAAWNGLTQLGTFLNPFKKKEKTSNLAEDYE